MGGRASPPVPDLLPSSLWLVQCHGFLVDVGDAPLGVVDDVVLASGAERPEALALVVSIGWFGRKRLVVPVEEVEVIVPDERRLVLVASPRYGGYRQRAGRPLLEAVRRRLARRQSA